MQEIVAIAKRDNNPKRNYLVLNRLQGKHLPASPGKALEYFGQLADLVKGAYAGERLLLIGFAETATGIGGALAVKLGTHYLQTTRETMEGVDFLSFTEAHSHATEQRLAKGDLDKIVGEVDRIVFVEDELTTGNTVCNIVSLLRRTYACPVNFAAASLLNGMDEQALERFAREKIGLLFLQKIDYRDFPRRAEAIKADGEYFPPHLREAGIEYFPPHSQEAGIEKVRYWEASSYVNARRLTKGEVYGKACEALWEQFLAHNGQIRGKRILVLGTEELMYPALYLGSRLEAENQVICHGTTRSPILVSRSPDALLYRRFALVSLYERERRTFVYNLEAYDQAIIVTDGPVLCREGVNSLIWALKTSGNQDIQLIRWCRK